VDAVFHFGDAEREEVGFDGGGAVHPPRGVDERLDELGFGGAVGLVFIEESPRVALIRGYVFGGQDNGLAGEAVAEGVQFRALLPGFGAWAGGMLGIFLLMAARSAARSWPLGTVDSGMGLMTWE
jgi:hypothetical protein